jgi:hypothetical protein
MSKFKGISNILKEKISDNSPELLIGMGLAGMLSSTIMACKATPKVYEMILDERTIRHRNKEPEMTKRDVVKIAWKPYIPAAIGFGVSAACILGANSINSKRNATLLTAYKIGERALIEYKDKVVEVIGEERELEIRDAVSRDRIKKDPINSNGVIITGKGDSLCYDMIFGRYFRCDIDTINRAINDLNFTMINDMYVSVNDFYELIGLDCIPAGFEMGWNIGDGKIDVHYSTQITDDNQLCLVINFNNLPKNGYDRLR